MIDAVPAGAGRHVMLLYRSLGEYLAACARYVEVGTTTGAAVLIAATREHLHGLGAQLPVGGSNAVLCDLSSQGADPGRVLSVIRMFARENSGGPVRCLQDVGWLGRPQEYLAEAMKYEALLCEALAESPADVMCNYDGRQGTDLLIAAEREHAVVRQGTTPRASAAFAEKNTVHEAVGRALSRPPDGAQTLTFRAEQGLLRRFAAAQARNAGLPASRVADLVIAIGELAGNTLQHTEGSGTLTIWTTDKEIVCQVSDSGQIADPLAGTLRPAPTEIGSRRGLWLVHQVSDLVQVRTGPSGTTVRVHMRLLAGEAGQASVTFPWRHGRDRRPYPDDIL